MASRAAGDNPHDRSPDENQDDGAYRQIGFLYLHRFLFRNGSRDDNLEHYNMQTQMIPLSCADAISEGRKSQAPISKS